MLEMVKWISHTETGKLALNRIRLERDDKDIILHVNGCTIAKFTHSGDILVDNEAIEKVKKQN
jgi:hypothetical protein